MAKVLNTEKLAQYLLVSVEYIRECRHEEFHHPELRGTLLPPGFRMGARGHWRYRIEDVERWAADRVRQNLASAGTTANEEAHA